MLAASEAAAFTVGAAAGASPIGMERLKMKTTSQLFSVLSHRAKPLAVFAALAFGLFGLALAGSAFAQQNSTTAQTPSANSTVSEKPGGKPFPSPQAAAAALCHAARHNDTAQLMVILGPEAKDLINPDDEQDPERAQQRAFFVQKYDQMHRLVKEPDDTVSLYIGAENWPLPIPLVEFNGSWYFDSSLGKQEVMYRQIGRNEMEAIGVSHGLVDAEKEYFGLDHTFTSKFVSAPGSRDGLYWKSNGNNTRSPIGPYLADAGVTDSTDNRQPFHGYFYRIVLQSGGSSGNANGFVIVAFPAEYRNSGVMTFFVDGNGNAYEKDLGPQTASAAMQITSAHADDTWKKVAAAAH
jgi:hypothetical protein